jgi:hypothetical protein
MGRSSRATLHRHVSPTYPPLTAGSTWTTDVGATVEGSGGVTFVPALAGLAGCAAVIISTGFSVGNWKDVPTVLVDEGHWKSFLQFIWYHPECMFIIGSILGVVALRPLIVVVSKHSTGHVSSTDSASETSE